MTLRLWPRSLRLALPLTVMAAFFLLAGFSQLLDYRQEREDVTQDAREQISAEAARFVRHAERQLKSAPLELQRDVAFFGATHHRHEIRIIALTDPDGRILFAQREEWRDQPIGAVWPTFDSRRFEAARGQSTAQVELDKTGHILSLAMSYAYPPSPGELTSQQRGVIYIERDLAPQIRERVAEQMRARLVQLGFGLLLSFGLAWWLHQRLTRPILAISEAAARIGAGNLDTPIKIMAGPELTALANDLSDMARQLKVDRADLVHERSLFKTLIQTLPDLVWLKDPDGVYLLCNPRFEQLLNRSESEIVGHRDSAFFTPEQVARFRAGDIEVIQDRIVKSRRETLRFASDNHEEHLDIAKTAMFDSEGHLIGVLGIGRDMTRQENDAKALQDSEAQYRLLAENGIDGIFWLDPDGRFRYLSPAFKPLFGHAPEAFIANPDLLLSLIHPADREAFQHHVHDQNLADRTELEFRIHHNSGETRWIAHQCQPVFDEAGRYLGRRGVNRDITARKAADAEIHRLAYFDELTGLPNRSLLNDRINQTLASHLRAGALHALLIINIDRFKHINAGHSHTLGDALLQAAGKRIASHLREGDTLARLGADEFALLLPTLAGQPEHASRFALTVAEKVQSDLRQPFALDESEFNITASIGITLFPEHANEDADACLRHGDTALQRAKAAGGNQIAFFEVSMGEAARQRFAIERELRQALANEELRLYLQPQVDARKHPVGAEILVRWKHPERGLVPPGAFIPIAEESDLIIDIGSWVLKRSLEILALCDMAGRPLRLSVNISPRQFRQISFVPWLKDVLLATGADPTYLTLEVTEGLVIDNLAETIAKMSELTALGIHFSIDDFGTGYSSLAYLKRLPIHELKIDRTFVQDAPTDPDDAALIETILAVARHMQLKVVAEGIETEAQAEFLNSRADIILQGFLYGRPEPVEHWLAHWQYPADCLRNILKNPADENPAR